jgi:tripartite-type tricarboxylate transporter receptor subunit TctC
MSGNAGFDSMKDFTHIAYLGGPPNVLVVHASLGIKTFKDFVDMASTAKEGVQYVSPSLGSVGNMVAEYMAERLKLNLSHVAYKGGGSAIFDLIAGHVTVGCLTFSTTRQHIEAGTLVPLAVSTEERLAEFPNLPTMKELGIPELVTATWYSLSGPHGIQNDVVAKLNGAFNHALADARVKKMIADEALQTKAMTPQDVTDYMQSEINKWSPLAKKLVPAK